MLTAAIYARYSSDRQSEHSIDDQVRLCQEHVARLGGQVARVYADYAISGANAHRPQLMAMMEDAKAGQFTMIVAEALDRISRDQEHTAGIFKRASFAGVKIVTVGEGEISELHVGLKGTMSALFLKDLALKTKRGQIGRVEAGFASGSLGYGYDMVRELDARGELITGKRRVNESEAAVIRRIFTEYGAGASPRAIATQLNREGVPSPRGGAWNASTINGNKIRRNGILHNELYRGILTYNRQTFVKDPETGKRVARPNPESEWKRTEVPELRIVDEDTFLAAQG
ncbi:MAG: recombinase family protein, partial [Magnetospirillum sp.]|nr:recombinase family protein [Magnetospirillum sp.]